MSKIWIIIGCFNLGVAAGYGLHFLSLIMNWWGVQTIILGWLIMMLILACIWIGDEVFIKWLSDKISPKEYYLTVSIITISVILGVLRWVLA